MTTTPPEAPPPPPPASAPPPTPHDDGPRVGRDDVRDLGRLRRSRQDRQIAGVAAGIARHLDVDPVVVRVLLAVLTVFGGAGLLVYGAGWLLLPEEDTGEAIVRLDDRTRTVALVVVGVLSALALLGNTVGGWSGGWSGGWGGGWGPPWPLAVVVLVVVALVGSRRRSRESAATYPDPAPAYRSGGVELGKPGTPPAPAPAPYVYPQRRRGPVLFWYAVALTAIGWGLLGVAEVAGASVTRSAYPAVALGVAAVGLLAGAFWGRAGGLIALGLVALVATAGSTAVAEGGGVGSEVSRPASVADVQDRYEVGFGELVVDLSGVPAAELSGLDVDVVVRVAGRAEIVVPDGVDVTVESSVDGGRREVFGDDLGEGSSSVTSPASPPVAGPDLTIDADVTFGELVVTRG